MMNERGGGRERERESESERAMTVLLTPVGIDVRRKPNYAHNKGV